MIHQIKLYPFLTLILFITYKILIPQTSKNPIIFFESSEYPITKRIFYIDSKIYFQINNFIVTQIDVNEKYFRFLEGADKKSFGIVKFYFEKRDEKSSFEIYLINEDFKITFYKKINFFYEEGLPVFLQLSSTDIVLLYPQRGLLQTLSSNNEKVLKLFLDDNNQYIQERIGHLFVLGKKMYIILSQIKIENDFESRIYEYDLINEGITENKINIDIIFKIFPHNNRLYFTGLEIEPVFQGGFYFLELNQFQFGEKNFSQISNEIIEGKVKNSTGIFYSRESFFELRDEKLIKLNFYRVDEIIIDVINIDKRFFVLTRKDLKTHLYELNDDFKIVNKEIIDRYLLNPVLNFYQQNKISIIDQNKLILTKIISEE